LEAPKAGQFDTRIAYQPHPNRGKSVPVEVTTGDKTIKMNSIVNMTQKPNFENGFHSVGEITLRKGQKVLVSLFAKGAQGNTHVDAAQLVPVD
jgi:penicillin V acylase-like amidase (Ntn superfamily)